jgi:hypothetical protein
MDLMTGGTFWLLRPCGWYPDESGDTYTDPRAAVTFYDNLGTKGGDEQYCDECPDGIESYAGAVGTEGPIFSWRKYELYEQRHNYGQPDSYINSQVIRFADVLLMLAESYIETNAVSNALPLLIVSGNVRVRLSISRWERRMRHGRFCAASAGRLAGEQARYFDLVRGSLVSTVMLRNRSWN